MIRLHDCSSSGVSFTDSLQSQEPLEAIDRHLDGEEVGWNMACQEMKNIEELWTERLRFFFAWNLGPLKCWRFRCFHGIDIPNLLPSTTLSQVRGELKSEAANLWVPGVAAYTFSLEAQRVLSPCSSSCCDLKSWGHFPFNWSHAFPCTFWDVLRRLTSSSWRSRGSCNVNLKWRSSVARRWRHIAILFAAL